MEQAFGSLKTNVLRVRLIQCSLESRVRAHVFLCLPVWNAGRYLRQVPAPLLFHEEAPELERETHVPVASAKP